MVTVRKRLALLVVLLLLLSGATALLITRTRAGRAEADTPPAASSAHPYGDPVWWPLREPTEIGCAKSGCGTSADHGYWAIDFLGHKDDPVYAAGAGIAHIGGNSGSCGGKSSDVDGGRWVWIDHGAGVVTRYYHLNSIAIKDGQLVTPATRIGAMGSSGDVEPCAVSYLHFEVREGGVNGTRVEPGPLQACTANGRVQLPDVFGVTGWDDPRLHPTRRLSSPAATSTCITGDWLSSPAQPRPTVSRASHTVTVTMPSLPAGSTTWQARVEIYHPTTKAWGSLAYRALPASTRSTTFTGLDDTKDYRADATARNGSGWSAWSSKVTAVGKPAAPRSPRFLTWPNKDYVHYGWYHADDLGSAVKTYDVARRCAKSSTAAYGAWTTYTQQEKDIYRNLRGLKSYKRCEVEVRATNAVGTGPWSKVSTVKR